MEVTARIPGVILAIHIKEGGAVKARDVLVTMEAMKMEQSIPCPLDGAVTAIRVAVGDKVKTGDVLAVIE